MLVVNKPKILNQELFKKRIDDILARSSYSNNGYYCQELERFAADYIKVKYCVAMVNATLALEGCLAWLKTKHPFGKIAVPSFTFAASVNSIVRAGFEPLFIDIDEDYCMSMDHLETVVSSDLAAIMPVNLFGNLYDYKYVSRYRNLPVIIDSAHALGCQVPYANQEEFKMVGSFGDCEVFSLHPNKIAGAMECGLVTTDNKEIYEFLLKFRNFGFKQNSNNPQGELTETIGTNAKINEISAAAALCQFECLPAIQSMYFDNYITYKQNLPDWCKLSVPNICFSNFSYIVCRVNPEIRSDFLSYLFANGIHARTYFQPLHTSPLYREKYGRVVLPNTERLAREVVSLPTGVCMDTPLIKSVCDKIGNYNYDG